MLVFADIKRMLDHVDSEAYMSAATVRPGSHRRPQISVLAYDCDRCCFSLNDVMSQLMKGSLTYDELFYEVPIVERFSRTIPWVWNDLEHYEHGVSNLVHFTDMDFQPWLMIENPLTDLWVDALRIALSAGAVTHEDLVREERAGNVRPSLLVQIERGLRVDQLPASAKRKDLMFTPPHRIGFTMRPAVKRPVSRLLGLGKPAPSLLNRALRVAHGAGYQVMKRVKGDALNKH
ncbi:hypothetical protein WQQ_20870 [Hydrocarboniphaga effusa AP103]|uniref:Uncharacterized protein n=2 Tax=Nevskiaceae TaxID=568386 RepID=I8TDB0_9GAMM|nr:hypothetical protein WQQ_20870 [Hydrocarboniphaga effusa AP103]